MFMLDERLIKYMFDSTSRGAKIDYVGVEFIMTCLVGVELILPQELILIENKICCSF